MLFKKITAVYTERHKNRMQKYWLLKQEITMRL
jgi:hypothetical protein